MELKELLDICNKYRDNVLDYNEVIEFLDSELVVSKYLSLSEKLMVLRNINTDLVICDIKTEDNVEYIYQSEIFKLFSIYLRYTDIKYHLKDISIEVYELLECIRLEEYIYNRCSFDIDKILCMYNDLSISFKIDKIKNEINSIDNNIMTENLDKIVELFQDKDSMLLMNKFMSFNNPKLDSTIKELDKLKKK